MSEPIKVGDLVVVVRDCCGHNLGYAYIVSRVRFVMRPLVWYCAGCLQRDSYQTIAEGHDAAIDFAMPLFWLKRIPPLSELEGEKRDEEITA